MLPIILITWERASAVCERYHFLATGEHRHMPYTITSGSVIEVTFNSTVGGQVCLSLFHYRVNAGASITDGGAYLTQFLADINAGTNDLKTAYLDAASSDLVLQLLTAQAITPTRFTRSEAGPGVNNQGIIVSPALPPATSGAITKRSASQVGRHARGTLHMPGVPTSFNAGGVLTQLGRAGYDALGAALATVITVTGNAATLTPVIFNRTSPEDSIPVDQGISQTNLRTMKRRVVGRGI